MDYDIIVIGSGAGGGTAAWALSRGGKRVLLLERGPRFEDPEAMQDEAETLIRMRPYENRDIWMNEKRRRLYVGGVSGGGTSLYGAALLRPSPEDFHPGRYYSRYIPRQQWDWPIAYDDLAPYYEQAEDLYGVAASAADPLLHLGQREKPFPQQPDPLVPISKWIARGVQRRGYHPFRLPLAIDRATCLRCPSCPGYLCPTGARASSLNRCIDPAIRDHGLEVWNDTEAERLLYQRNGSTDARVTGVRVTRNGETREVTAEKVVVAAGAIGTPVLLTRSSLGARSGQLGRNYMYHDGGIAAGVYYHPTGAGDKFGKQIGFTDLYFGTSEFPFKLGYAQVLPVPGPKTIQAMLPFPLPDRVARWAHARIITLAGSVEDLPQATNRIQLRRNGSIIINHKFHPFDRLRSNFYKREVTKIMYAAGAQFVVGATGEADETHTAHQVGTARFGTDPEFAVLDRNNRIYGTQNAYVVDGSFMPTSLGVGPALTIIANSLRVSDHILGEGA
ncbi:GMC family oxidoreductase [bacterium]|nr:GMC family oxidoreductase [bacterium]